jgi:serine/threonine kinase PknH
MARGGMGLPRFRAFLSLPCVSGQLPSVPLDSPKRFMGVVKVHPTEGSSPDGLEPDEADTGPLQVSDSTQADDGWRPPAGTWAGRFDAPLTVNPRQVQDNRKPVIFFSGVAIVVIAAVGGLIWWLMRPSADTPDAPSTSASAETDADVQALMRLLPAGYAEGSCKPVAAPKGVRAQVNCDTNSDPGGPMSGNYSLVGDKAALDNAFNDIVGAATRVNCPGNIQSPGPWRRNATPDKASGTLFCGLAGDRPVVTWTDDARLLVSSVQGGPQAPTFDQLYAWWSSHS